MLVCNVITTCFDL